jgi:hypothetical protein
MLWGSIAIAPKLGHGPAVGRALLLLGIKKCADDSTLTSWSKGEEIERYAELIDRLASQLEDVALDAVAPGGMGSGELGK